MLDHMTLAIIADLWIAVIGGSMIYMLLVPVMRVQPVVVAQGVMVAQPSSMVLSIKWRGLVLTYGRQRNSFV